LAVDPIESAASGFPFQVEGYYAGLISALNSNSERDCEPSLGGKLLYAGELDVEARALMVAANIAGAASLVVSKDASTVKQAIRNAIVDFLVTSLDEALRILKNEIRKCQTVAVCVGCPPDSITRQMQDRGVVPDLTRPTEFVELKAGQILLAWRVTASHTIWLPKLDTIALDCLDPEAGTARRWLRLAPRYLGRMTQGVRLLRCSKETACRFRERVKIQVENSEIGAGVELMLRGKGGPEFYSFTPPTC
jgi:urocanate hydratase